MMPLDHARLFTPVGATRRRPVGNARGRWAALGAALALHLLVAFLLHGEAAPRAGHAEPALKLFIVPPAPPPAAVKVPPKPPVPVPASSKRMMPPPDVAPNVAPVVPVVPAMPLPVLPKRIPAVPEVSPPEPRATAAWPDAANALADYQRLLWRRIHARRPRNARLTGSTLVRFRLARDGSLLSVVVHQSSGSMILDQLAVQTVRRASPFPAVPAAVTGDALVFDIPIDFR